MERREEKHFVLVHGACHGAWCWYRLITLLRSDGHRVTALDMAASGIHPKQVDDLSSVSDYSEPLMRFMESLPAVDKVILVGHSRGGVDLSLAMERFPEKIEVAVFVTAFMPGPNFSAHTITQELKQHAPSYMDSQYNFSNGLDKPPTSILFGPKLLSSKFYQLSPPEDFALANLLMRPVPLHSDGKLMKEIALTGEKYGSVRRVYVICELDATISEVIQRWMIRNNPPDDVKVISGSDHMVMFSKPQELCSCLLEISKDYQ